MISTKLKLSNLTYENIVNYYLDEDTVMPEEILPGDKWVNSYRSDIEVKNGMTRALQEAKKQRENKHGRQNSLFKDKGQSTNSSKGTGCRVETGKKYTASGVQKRIQRAYTRCLLRALTSPKSVRQHQQLKSLENPLLQLEKAK